MKLSSFATFSLAIVVTFGVRGLSLPPPAAPTGLFIQPTSMATAATVVPGAPSTLPAPPPNLTAAHATTLATRTRLPSATPTAVTITPSATGDTDSTIGLNISAGGAPGAARYTLALDPVALSINTLRSRTYGGGAIKITRVVSEDEAFERVLFEYPSDGLRVTGMMLVPRGAGPFPVVILDHGYFKPSEYKTGDGSVRAAESFARHGYLTLAPDYRCYGGSQCGPNPLYVGYAIDVLNLIGSLSSLSNADTSRIGIWGHSMGGGITIRVLTISSQIKVAALYGALSSDDEVHYCWLYGCPTPAAAPTREVRSVAALHEADPDFVQGAATPAPSAAPDQWARLHEIFVKSSPSRYLSFITAPVIIHHGEKDDIVPIDWSVGLADALQARGLRAPLYTYPGEGHVFAGWSWQLFMARTISFFDEYLNPRASVVTVEERVLRQERAILDSTYW